MNMRNWLAASAVLLLTAMGGAHWQEADESTLDAPGSVEPGEGSTDSPSDPFEGNANPGIPFGSQVSADPFAGSNSADPFGDRKVRNPFGRSSRVSNGQAETEPGSSGQPMLREEENNSRLMQALQVEYDGPPIVDVPLSEFFETLEQERGIKYWIDERALEEESVDPDSPVRWETVPIRLQTMLDLILENEVLTYRIKDGILIITTTTDAEEKQELRVYECMNLYPNPQQWVRPERPAPTVFKKPTSAGAPGMSGAGGASGGSGMGAGAPSAANPGDLLGGLMGAGSRASQDNIEQLIHVIQSTVDPLSWEENGGPAGATIHTFRSKLVVRNTARVHNEIRYLLEELTAN